MDLDGKSRRMERGSTVTTRPLPTIAAILTLSLATMPVPAASLLANSLRLVNAPAPDRPQIAHRAVSAPPSRAEWKRFRCVLRDEDFRPAALPAPARWRPPHVTAAVWRGRRQADLRSTTPPLAHLRC